MSWETEIATIADFERFLDTKEAFLDSFIDSGSEQELFVSSYIHGHFSVVAANMLSSIKHESDEQLQFDKAAFYTQCCHVFWQDLSESINKAIHNKELTENDAHQVLALLKVLCAH